MVCWRVYALLSMMAGILRGSPCSLWGGARYFDGYCYFISKIIQPYDEAKVSCEQLSAGMKLAELNSKLHYRFLREMATEMNLDPSLGSGVLLAGRRDNNSGNFLWPSGNSVSLPLMPGRTLSLLLEDCLEMNLVYNLALNDVNCEQYNYFACEKYIGDPCESVLAGSEFYGGYCFKLYDQMLSWHDAKTTCEEDGGYLAEPKYLALYQFLLLLVKITPDLTYSDYYYIGASDEKKEGDFRWLTSSEPMSLCQWREGEPSNRGSISPENQLVIQISTRKLNDVNGMKLANFFCQKELMEHSYVIVVPKKLLLPRTQLVITALSWEKTFYTVKQYLSGNFMCSDSKLTASDVAAVLEPQKFIDVNKSTAINSNGKQKEYVKVVSTHPLTIILTIPLDSSLCDATSMYILPVDLLTQSYFLLSLPQSSGQLTVTAIDDNTEVILKVPQKYRQDTILGIGGFSVRQSGYATITLDKYETVIIETTGLRTGFLYSSKPIAVFNFIEKTVQDDEITLTYPLTEMLIPAELMASQYVTFPSWPMSDMVKYQLLAIYDYTFVQVFGPEYLTVVLAKAGDVAEITLPGSGFYYMESNVPYQAKIMSLSSMRGSCITALLPSTLWHTEYVVAPVQQSAAEYLVSPILFTISELPAFDVSYPALHTCMAITGTQLLGCYFQVTWDMHHPLYISNNGARFAAYIVWIKEASQALTCYSLGTDSHIRDLNMNIFDVLTNINFSDAACEAQSDYDFVMYGSHHSLINQHTVSEIQSNILSASENTQIHMTEKSTIVSTHVPKEVISRHSLRFQDAEVLRNTGEISSLKNAREEMLVIQSTQFPTEEIYTSSNNHISILAELISPSTPILSEDVSASTLFPKEDVSVYKNSFILFDDDVSSFKSSDVHTQEVSALETTVILCWSVREPKYTGINDGSDLNQLQRVLEVDHKTVSAFRRMKTSVPDPRISSKMIGLCGVLILIVYIFIIVMSDVKALFCFFISKCQRKYNMNKE